VPQGDLLQKADKMQSHHFNRPSLQTTRFLQLKLYQKMEQATTNTHNSHRNEFILADAVQIHFPIRTLESQQPYWSSNAKSK
jgi:hypothetical protein